jgi:hypothetical protein
MTDLPPPSEQPQETQDLKLARACRFAFLCVLLVASSQNVTTCMRIRPAESIFVDMLGAASALPTITVWALKYEPVLRVVALLIPLIAIGLYWVRNVRAAIYAAGVLFFFTSVMQAVVSKALEAPMLEIIHRMQGGPSAGM